MPPKTAEKTKTNDNGADTDSADEKSSTTTLPPGKHWEWKDGEWIEQSIAHASDAEFRRMLKHMPASAWSILASAFDQAAFRPAQAEDVALAKAFIVKVTRHPQFTAELKDALSKRAQG